MTVSSAANGAPRSRFDNNRTNWRFICFSPSLSDSTDIVDCKLKLILGLIWTLILHYSISVPMWDGEDEKQLNGSGTTPKQRYVNFGSHLVLLLIYFFFAVF